MRWELRAVALVLVLVLLPPGMVGAVPVVMAPGDAPDGTAFAVEQRV